MTPSRGQRSTAWIALSLVVLLALAVTAVVWLQFTPQSVRTLREAVASLTTPAPPPPALLPLALPVTVAAARSGDVPIYLSGIGTVQAYNTVAVTSRVDGQIVQVLFHEGQDVREGDPIVIIDPRPLQAQLEQQRAARARDEARLEAAKLNLVRYEELVKRDFATRQQVDDQRALVDQTRAQILSDQAQIDYATTQLSYTTIRSPIEGRVGIRLIDIGNVVHAADTNALVTITQLRPISVVFTLPSVAVGQSNLTPGEVAVPVCAYAPNGTTLLDCGTVYLVDNTVDQTTGTIKLKANFPNTKLLLWPGNFVNGKLVVETRRDAVTIPVAALRHGPRGDFVWIVQADDTVAIRPVTAGQLDNGRVLIERGLKRGERVVTEGYYRLDQGARVDIARGGGAARPLAPAAGEPASSD